MLLNLNHINRLRAYFSVGHERSLRLKKSILTIGISKVINVFIQILLVPLTISYINPYNYGIWLTLSSIISWFSLFDIGLSNGLRNNLAQAIALNNKLLSKIYISTTYALLTFIVLLIIILFLSFFGWINWTNLFKADTISKNELHYTIALTFVFFCVKFIFQLINTILLSDQRPGLSNIITTVGSLFTLIILFIFNSYTSGSLIILTLVSNVVPVIILLLASLILFKGIYRYYSPSVKYVSTKHFKGLLSVGFRFFLVQFAAIFVLSATNFAITQLCGPDQVTIYNVSQKYYYSVILIFNIITVPLWSAFTEAYTKNDIAWIQKIISKLFKIWIIFTLITVVLFTFSNLIFSLWVPMINIPRKISLLMAIYTILTIWISIYVPFINGVGKIKVQMIHSLFIILSYIPSVLYLKYLNISYLFGITIITIIYQFIGAVWTPIQYFKLINNKAKGIWNE